MVGPNDHLGTVNYQNNDHDIGGAIGYYTAKGMMMV